jgi:GTP-binding protein EngB required for normal cell division
MSDDDGFLSPDEYFAKHSTTARSPEGYRSGFVSLVGRPNVGKSSAERCRSFRTNRKRLATKSAES